ncbi:DUF6325 family protein [Polymorphobacter fuscus]|uniref:DUF1269 domain-containing protein n=1 Tax=Sandarakinorhabdus fusca TaxID=1439888 RepID=A0A7C9KY04_9SPHN|nr:DUF6325 family protein [Polymorphobacter fuscus]KAB7648790.1 hypothetical protein F9290_03740 [Polymorphobacter fuscus]MQT16368.1 hypothetical protein [Polymorphobacter fuscus]NJC07343.1 hypothetical protein [Polymorphobacter fuscus]
MTDATGPIELIVLAFDGNRFNGDITPALVDLVERGIVRVIDLAVVVKDDDGAALILEMQELPDDIAAAVAGISGAASGLLSEADLNELADDMKPNSTVAALLCEHVWATGFANAVRSAGGTLVLSERIPGDVVDAARATLLATTSQGD